MDMRSAERSALVALLRRPAVSWSKVASGILEYGDASAATRLLEDHLRETEGLFPEKDVTALQEEAHALIRSWEQQGIGVHACFDPEFPSQLRDIREMPPIVFSRGKLVEDRRAIAVVGTRKASEKGLLRARTISGILADNDITVVSGLAEGIDTAAHRAALDKGARTVAVIGTGVNQYYPRRNVDLQNEIASTGMVLSQFWPDAKPSRESFPMRNVIMSGYASATVVVQASQNSGTRIQVRHALRHGRAVILLKDVLEVPWAKALEDSPGVRVVNDPAQLWEAVEDILSPKPTFPLPLISHLEKA